MIFFLCSPLWNEENKSCLNEIKLCQVSGNPKSSICCKFHLSISKTGESPLLTICVFPITHPLFYWSPEKKPTLGRFCHFDCLEKSTRKMVLLIFYLLRTLKYQKMFFMPFYAPCSFDPSLLPKKLWLIFMGMKQKNSKWLTQKNWVFQFLQFSIFFSENFRDWWEGKIDGKGIDVAIWSSGCPT